MDRSGNHIQQNPYVTELEMSPSQPDQDEEAQFRNLLLKGKPMLLGAVQILIVFIQIAVGTTIILSESGYNVPFYITYSGAYYISFWSIPFYLISGSLSIAVEAKQSPPKHLVKAYMAMNILSSLVSPGIFIVCFFDMANAVYYGASILTALVTFSAIANILEFCITVPLIHFANLAITQKYGEEATDDTSQNASGCWDCFKRIAENVPVGDIIENIPVGDIIDNIPVDELPEGFDPEMLGAAVAAIETVADVLSSVSSTDENNAKKKESKAAQ